MHLQKKWNGVVWCNPPYSKGLQVEFIKKAIHEVYHNELIKSLEKLLHLLTRKNEKEEVDKLIYYIKTDKGKKNMNNQEALEALDDLVSLANSTETHSRIANESEAVLQKVLNHFTVPTKPNHTHELKQFGKCPSCNETVNIQANKGFCGVCGKALEWK